MIYSKGMKSIRNLKISQRRQSSSKYFSGLGISHIFLLVSVDLYSLNLLS